VPFSSYYGRHIPLVHTACVPFGQAHVHVAAHVLRVEQYLPKATKLDWQIIALTQVPHFKVVI
jgi:hypothetical protein